MSLHALDEKMTKNLNEWRRSVKTVLLLFILTSCASPYVQINSNKIDIVIADEQEDWTSGLQNVVSMSEDSGMLFVSPAPRDVTFWMKDTLIPLDMIFIDENNVIQFIRKNVQPCQQDPCTTYSHNNIKYVLEVNAGYTDKHAIKTGDKVIVRIQ